MTPLASPQKEDNPLFNPIRGADYIGAGFNIFKSDKANPFQIGSPVQERIVGEFSFSLNKTWSDGSNTFSVPDEVSLLRGGQFGVRHYSYLTISDYLDEEAWNFGFYLSGKPLKLIPGVKEIPIISSIPVGISAGISHLDAELKLHGGAISLIEETVPVYTLRMLPMESLDSRFVSAVRKLYGMWPIPTSALDSFVDQFGTHVQAGLDMGGLLQMGGVITELDKASFTKTSLSASLHIAFLSLKGSGSVSSFSGINRNTANHGTQRYRMGGDNSIPYTQDHWYSSWVKSVPRQPARTSYQLEPITTYVAMVSPDVAKALGSYIEARMDALSAEAAVAKDVPITFGMENGPKGGLTGATAWSGDDDDECLDWYWFSYSNEEKSRETYAKPVEVSWKNTFGPVPFADGKGNPSLIEKESTPLQLDRTVTTLNGECGYYPCLPGLDSLGIGYDAVTGVQRLPAMSWTYSKQRSYIDPDSGIAYAVPDQVRMNSDGSSSQYSNVYTSYQEYLQNSTNTVISGWNGLFFHWGKEERSVMATFDQAQSVLGVNEKYYTKYALSVLEPTISPALQREIDRLPEEYNQEVYFRFLARWGTHFTSAASYGGRARLFAMIDQSFFANYDSFSIQKHLGLAFAGWEAGIAWGSNSTSAAASFSRQSFQWVSFYGGDATLALTNQWSDWIKSTKLAPTQINRILTPIQDFASSNVTKKNIETAVLQYQSINMEPPQPPISLNMFLASSHTSLSNSIIATMATSCIWNHGDDDVVNFVTGYNRIYYYWNIPAGFYTPRSIQLFNCVWRTGSLHPDIATQQVCHPGEYITNVRNEKPNCSLDDCKAYLLSLHQVYCCQLGY